MKHLLWLVAVGLQCLAQVWACDAPVRRPDAVLGARIDAIVDAAVADGFAGGVTVMRDGTIVYDRVAGFADARHRVPVAAHTLFHVASITKYFTATMVAKAAEEGRLRLDQPVETWLPGTQLAARGATVLDLLAHRSGMGASYAAEQFADSAEALAAIDRIPVAPDAVGRFRYSNDGYDVLAIILERVYGQPYERLLREHLLAPACLTDVAFWGETKLADPQRVGQPLRAISPSLRKRNYGMIGSAGLLITAHELARWEDALTRGRVLAPAWLQELQASRGKVSIGEATFGAFRVNTPRLGVVNSARGFEDWGDNAILNRYPSGVIVAVVTSKGPAEGAGEAFRNRISRQIEAELADSARTATNVGP